MRIPPTIPAGGDRGGRFRPRRPARWGAAAVITALALLLAACTGSSGSAGPAAQSTATSAAAAPAASSSSVAAVRSPYTKVLVIAEENETYDQVLGGTHAPYLIGLARTYGSATAMFAGDAVSCPSLPSYLIMTSGDRFGICDDNDPSSHPISAANVFQQVAVSGRQWRDYAESMPAPCLRTDSPDGLYAVRHAPASYYVTEAGRCPQWDIPMGTPTLGALHDDITAGTLPAYGFVSPNVCDDMHGGPGCAASVATGDTWLRQWIPTLMAGSDYRSGRLAIVITWDEGSDASNHTPLVVISPTTQHLSVTQPLTLCSVLRGVEDILHLAPLGCAAQAKSVATAFHLTS